ncbi:MAG TPA: hypothetical protein VFM06_10215 [Candidatus Limnocylindria bacterium]|nr:hypothetical protein [Candidatus Limnocylindria bacterium]
MSSRTSAPGIVALAVFALAIVRAPSDSDMYWHLASGRWMLEHSDILRTDVFTTTVAGQPYSVGEWLGQVVLYLAYAIGGWPGLALLRGLLVGVAAFFLTRVALRATERTGIAILLVVPALVLSSIVWTDRPHLFTLAFFPLLLDVLFAARAGRTRWLLVVPPLLLIWTNLHGGYALGLATAGIFAVAALLERGAWRAFGAAAIVGGIATLADPGSLGLLSAIEHAASPPRFIVEEAPPDVLRPAGFVFALFALGTLAVALRAGGSLLDALLLIPLLWLALSAQRDMPYFAFAAVPYLARALPLAAPRLARARVAPSPRALSRVRHPARAVGMGLAAGAVAMAVLGIAALPSGPDESAYPTGAVAPLREGRGTLLHEYDWGGYLIWRVPERPVFIDGRLFPFLPRVYEEWRAAVMLGPRWRDVLARHDVTTVLLRPDRPLVGALRDDGWREVAGAAGWILLARP